MPKSFISIYVLGGLIALFIIAMSLFFIIKATRRAKTIGISKKTISQTIKGSAIFSIIPSIPIVIGVGIMMQFLGLAIPWIRLTVIGALQYELMAMDQAVSVLPKGASTEVMVATSIFVMTLCIVAGPLFNALFYKKYQTKLADIQQKNAKLMDTITGALLGGLLAGMISSIVVGGIFSIGNPVENAGGAFAYGEVTLITVATSIGIMGICGAILVLGKQKWIENYALPLTIVGALGVAYACVPLFA